MTEVDKIEAYARGHEDYTKMYMEVVHYRDNLFISEAKVVIFKYCLKVYEEYLTYIESNFELRDLKDLIDNISLELIWERL